MELNTIKPAAGSKHAKKRLGRGIGSGWGKTAGRGHKGQTSRSGGFHKVGFEGGQMPLQRRLPKRGFIPLAQSTTTEVRVGDLAVLQGEEVITLDTLKQAGLVSALTRKVKLFLSGGDLTVALKVKGLKVSKGAQEAIEKAGGAVLAAE